MRFVVAHRGVTLALTWVVAVALAGALGLLVADVSTAKADADAVRALVIAVVVDPPTPAAEAKALGARIGELPDVGETVFRSKDDGLKALAAAGLPAPDGPNPLSDLWLVRLKPEAVLATPRGVAAAVAAVRQGIGGMTPAAVRVDDALVASIDAALRRSRSTAPVLLWGGLAVIGLVCVTVGYLAGAATTRSDASSWSALAFMTMAAAVGASILLAIAVAGTGAVNGMPFDTLQDKVGLAFAERRVAFIVVPIALWLAVALGALAGADRSAPDS